MNDSMAMVRRIALAVLVAAMTMAVFAATGVVTAQDGPTTRKEQRKAHRSAAVRPAEDGATSAGTVAKEPAKDRKSAAKGVSSQQAAVDPSTGGLRQPTPEEARDLAALSQSPVGDGLDELDVVELPDGTLMVDLEDRIQDIAMATRDADGRTRVVCLHGAKAAEALLKQSAAAAETAGQRASRQRAKGTAQARSSNRPAKLEEE